MRSSDVPSSVNTADISPKLVIKNKENIGLFCRCGISAARKAKGRGSYSRHFKKGTAVYFFFINGTTPGPQNITTESPNQQWVLCRLSILFRVFSPNLDQAEPFLLREELASETDQHPANSQVYIDGVKTTEFIFPLEKQAGFPVNKQNQYHVDISFNQRYD